MHTRSATRIYGYHGISSLGGGNRREWSLEFMALWGVILRHKAYLLVWEAFDVSLGIRRDVNLRP